MVLHPLVAACIPPSIDPKTLTQSGSVLRCSRTGASYFAKTGRTAQAVAQFRGEAAGLRAMAATAPPALVPTVVGLVVKDSKVGMVSTYAEWSTGGGIRKRWAEYQRMLGEGVARMHQPPRDWVEQGRVDTSNKTDTTTSTLVPEPGLRAKRGTGAASSTTAQSSITAQPSSSTMALTTTPTQDPTFASDYVYTGQYGFPIATHCGATEQDNTWETSWEVFFRDRRLGPLVDKLGHVQVSRLWEKMKAGAVPLLLHHFDPPPKPVILHGDLWNGNMTSTDDGPVIYDPASYYGHGEADLGIARMFGGFSQEFFDAYHSIHPRSQPYYEQRQQLYELYHHLNHAVMFGGGYVGGALQIMDDLVEWAEQEAEPRDEIESSP